MNAFDLAEWASVHPAVRSSSPAMLTTLLLRLPLVAVSVGMVLVSGGVHDPRVRWVVRGAAILVVLRLFPPVEFFTSARDDPNYRQMALLVILAGGGMVVALVAQLPEGIRNWSVVGLMAVGSAAGWWGLSRAGLLLDSFAIDVQIGAGPVGFSISAIVALFVVLWAHKKTGGQYQRY